MQSRRAESFLEGRIQTLELRGVEAPQRERTRFGIQDSPDSDRVLGSQPAGQPGSQARRSKPESRKGVSQTARRLASQPASQPAGQVS